MSNGAPNPLQAQSRLMSIAGVVTNPLSIIKMIGTCTVSLVGAITSIGSFHFTDPLVVDVASVCTVGFAPYVVSQEMKLEDLSTVEKVNTSINRKINRMKKANEQLGSQIDEMEDKMKRLSLVQEGFDKLVDKSKLNADSVLSMVKETSVVQDQMQSIMKTRMIAEVLSILMRGDRSGDFEMNETEMEIVILRISNQPGIRFDEESFRKKMKQTKDHSINTILKVCRNLMDDNPDDDDQLFSVGK